MKTTKKILIAHHDAGMRRRLVMLFAAAGFDVRSFVSPDAVLEGARAEWFDLALIDGDGAGSALATGLREIQPTVQLLLMVPKMDLGMVVQGIRQGAAEVVVLTDDPMPVLRQALAFFRLEAPEGLDAGEVAALEAAGVDRIQWDVMDGQFVPNLTFGPDVIAAARRHTSLPFEAHLMVLTPDVMAAEYVKAGCSRLIVHVEACTHLHRTLANIASLGATASVALKIGRAHV